MNYHYSEFFNDKLGKGGPGDSFHTGLIVNLAKDAVTTYDGKVLAKLSDFEQAMFNAYWWTKLSNTFSLAVTKLNWFGVGHPDYLRIMCQHS